MKKPWRLTATAMAIATNTAIGNSTKPRSTRSSSSALAPVKRRRTPPICQGNALARALRRLALDEAQPVLELCEAELQLFEVRLWDEAELLEETVEPGARSFGEANRLAAP